MSSTSLAKISRFFLPVSLAAALVACPGAPENTRVEGTKALCIVTQYTENQAAFATLAAQNQAAYAKRHGYSAFSHVGRVSGDRFMDPTRGNSMSLWGGGLYWQKIAVVENALAERTADGNNRCDWVMWVDADIVFTNFAIPLEERLQQFAPTAATDVILSREEAGFAASLVNAGAFFVRNSPGGRAFMQEIGALYEAYKDSLLPEQDAMQDAVFQVAQDDPRRTDRAHVDPRQRSNIALAPQRAFNAFHRPHLDIPPSGRWYPCDLIAHMAGLPARERVVCIEELEASISACEPQ